MDRCYFAHVVVSATEGGCVCTSFVGKDAPSVLEQAEACAAFERHSARVNVEILVELGYYEDAARHDVTTLTR